LAIILCVVSYIQKYSKEKPYVHSDNSIDKHNDAHQVANPGEYLLEYKTGVYNKCKTTITTTTTKTKTGCHTLPNSQRTLNALMTVLRILLTSGRKRRRMRVLRVLTKWLRDS